MLRHVLGEQKFFDALQTYATRFAFSNASTRDFQQVCEEKYGDSLDWFFSQWIYAAARPVYKVSAEILGSPSGLTVTLVIKQKQTHEIPGRAERVYIMPLDVTIHYVDETSETHVVWNDARKQKFTFTASKPVESVNVDDGHWVLKKLK
jgi:aminopeptidase N